MSIARSSREVLHDHLRLRRVGALEWTADSGDVRTRDRVDSYLIEDGKICAQTLHSASRPPG